MAKKGKKQEQENDDVMFDVMPGADPMEDDQGPVDLSFGLSDNGEAAVTAADVVAEDEVEPTEEEEVVEAAEEVSEETVAEDMELEPAEDAPARIVEDVEQAADDGKEADETGNTDTVAEEQPKETTKRTKGNHMIPKARLDEVLDKLKASQKELEDMKLAQTPPPDAPEAYDFDAKEAEYMNLVLDGQQKEAVSLRQQIRTAEKTQLEWEMSQKMAETVSFNQTATTLQRAASELEATFPVFDKTSDQYSEEMTQEVIELRDAFIIKGEDPVNALSKAAAFVVKSNEMISAEEQPALADSQAPKVDEVAKKRGEVTKKLSQAKAQPPELPGESSSSRGEKPINLANMSEEEFNALPAATLKRLRGDLY